MKKVKSTDRTIRLFSGHFHNPSRRGIAIYSHELVQALSRILRETAVQLFDYFWLSNYHEYLPRISNPNFKMRIFRCPGRVFDFFNKHIGWPNLEMFGKRLDLIHVMHEHLVPNIKCKNVIMTVHGLGPILYPELYNKDFALRWKTSLDSGLKTAVKVIAVSKSVEEQLRNYRPEYSAKFCNTPLGVPKGFLVDRDADTERKMLISKGIDFPYILYAGAADRGKNLNRLIDAFSIYLKERSQQPPLRFVIIGNPQWGGYERIKQQARHLSIENRIHFTGYIDHSLLPAFYRGCDLFVFPALFEGFGLPLLEAMASGAACLTSNRPALNEVGADVVEYFDPDSVEDMAEKMIELMDNSEKRYEMGQKAKKYANNLTWDRTARHTIRIYEEILNVLLV